VRRKPSIAFVLSGSIKIPSIVRNPETRKRVGCEQPIDHWTFAEVPHHRIIDKDLWEAAHLIGHQAVSKN
jgi:hypothetical protein